MPNVNEEERKRQERILELEIIAGNAMFSKGIRQQARNEIAKLEGRITK